MIYLFMSISNPTYSFIERNKYIGWSDVIMADSYLVEVFNSSDDVQHYTQKLREAWCTFPDAFPKKIIQCSA